MGYNAIYKHYRCRQPITSSIWYTSSSIYSGNNKAGNVTQSRLYYLSLRLHTFQAVLLQHIFRYALPFAGCVTLVAKVVDPHFTGKKANGRQVAHFTEERHALHYVRFGLGWVGYLIEHRLLLLNGTIYKGIVVTVQAVY